MASWGLVPAFTGFGYDGRSAVMSFARSSDGAKWFWSTGSAWGTVQQSFANDGKLQVQLDVLGGRCAYRPCWARQRSCLMLRACSRRAATGSENTPRRKTTRARASTFAITAWAKPPGDRYSPVLSPAAAPMSRANSQILTSGAVFGKTCVRNWSALHHRPSIVGRPRRRPAPSLSYAGVSARRWWMP